MKHSGQKKNLHFSIALFIIYQLSSVKSLNEKTQPYSVINMEENTESSEQTNEEIPQVNRRGYAGEDFYQKASKNIPRMGRRGLRSDSEDQQNAILEFDNKVKRPYTKLPVYEKIAGEITNENNSARFQPHFLEHLQQLLAYQNISQLPEESLWPWDSDRVPQHLKRTNVVENCRQWPRMEKFVNDLEFCNNNLACCSPIKDSSILKRFLQTYSSKQTSPRPNYKNNQYMK